MEDSGHILPGAARTFPGKRDQENPSAIGEALGILLAPLQAFCGRWRQRKSSQKKAYLIDAQSRYERDTRWVRANASC